MCACVCGEREWAQREYIVWERGRNNVCVCMCDREIERGKKRMSVSVRESVYVFVCVREREVRESVST